MYDLNMSLEQPVSLVAGDIYPTFSAKLAGGKSQGWVSECSSGACITAWQMRSLSWTAGER